MAKRSSSPPLLLAGGLLGALFGKPRFVVITDTSARALKAEGAVKAGDFKEELASKPIADLDMAKTWFGMFGQVDFPNGEKAYFSRIFFKRIDAALGG